MEKEIVYKPFKQLKKWDTILCLKSATDMCDIPSLTEGKSYTVIKTLQNELTSGHVVVEDDKGRVNYWAAGYFNVLGGAPAQD